MHKSDLTIKKDGPAQKCKTIKFLCIFFLLGIWGFVLACIMSAELAPKKDWHIPANGNHFRQIASQSKYAICGAGFLICILTESRISRGSVNLDMPYQTNPSNIETDSEKQRNRGTFKGGEFTLPKVFMRIGWALSILFFTTFFLFWGFVFTTLQQFIGKLLKPKRFLVEFLIASVTFPVLLNLMGFLILW